MTVSEEVKEAVLKFRETNDFETFERFIDELDLSRDGEVESHLACKYLFENVVLVEVAKYN